MSSNPDRAHRGAAPPRRLRRPCPGLTGLAQVQNIDMSDPPRLAEVDAAYLATRSFRGDLEIIFRTVFGGGNRWASRG